MQWQIIGHKPYFGIKEVSFQHRGGSKTNTTSRLTTPQPPTAKEKVEFWPREQAIQAGSPISCLDEWFKTRAMTGLVYTYKYNDIKPTGLLPTILSRMLRSMKPCHEGAHWRTQSSPHYLCRLQAFESRLEEQVAPLSYSRPKWTNKFLRQFSIMDLHEY